MARGTVGKIRKTVEIELGGETRTLYAGFGEVMQVEEVTGVSFMDKESLSAIGFRHVATMVWVFLEGDDKPSLSEVTKMIDWDNATTLAGACFEAIRVNRAMGNATAAAGD